MKKVVKFGGSSLASAEQFVKVGNIIHSDEDRKFVVPSAPGKRYDNDTKVTVMVNMHMAEINAQLFDFMFLNKWDYILLRLLIVTHIHQKVLAP